MEIRCSKLKIKNHYTLCAAFCKVNRCFRNFLLFLIKYFRCYRYLEIRSGCLLEAYTGGGGRGPPKFQNFLINFNGILDQKMKIKKKSYQKQLTKLENTLGNLFLRTPLLLTATVRAVTVSFFNFFAYFLELLLEKKIIFMNLWALLHLLTSFAKYTRVVIDKYCKTSKIHLHRSKKCYSSQFKDNFPSGIPKIKIFIFLMENHACSSDDNK